MGRALVYFGCTSHYLGALASVLRRWDEAEEHYEDALQMHEEIGARSWVARTQSRYARMLQERNHGDDPVRAVALFERAFQAASVLGMQRFAQRIAERRQALPADVGKTHRVESTTAGRSSHALFQRDGDYWSVGFEGNLFRLKDSKGLQYVAQLLRHPNRHLHVMELASLGSAPPRAQTVDTLGETNVHISRLDDAPELLDAEARASYEDRFRHLCAEIEEASEFNDLDRAERARRELDLLTDQFASAAGLGGRSRRAASAAERARVNVTKQIRVAIHRIEAHAPALAADLKRSVRTGRVCSYTPDPRAPIEWKL
jgi:hypothetical protein